MGSCVSKSSGRGSDSVGLPLDSCGGSGRWMNNVKFGSCEGENKNKNHVSVPGKMFSSGASDVACLYTQQGKKGTNQDAMIVWENYNSRRDTIFCGVFDGHGPFGHMVARRVRDSLPLILSTQWNTACSSENQETISNTEDSTHPNGAVISAMDDQWSETLVVDEENEKLPEVHYPLRQSMLKAFNLMDKELRLHPTINCFCSGSTAVTLLKQGRELIIGNVGDSRGILATRDENNNLVAVQLTVDLKPDLPREAARIQQCKGRVFALQDEPEVARVWLPNNDSPGLAMARAFGDFCLKDFGLISVPDIFYRHLTEKDEFVILATDGVWDVLSNKEAVDIVASAPSRSTAARALVDCAVRAWRLKYPNSKTDDCAAVCLFLDDASTRPMNGTALTKPETCEMTEIPIEDSDHQHDVVLERMGTLGPSEIVPVSELTEENGHFPARSAKKSLAECIAGGEDEEWSALEGVTRVNSLLSLPRFGSGDSKSASWRKKWL